MALDDVKRQYEHQLAAAKTELEQLIELKSRDDEKLSQKVGEVEELFFERFPFAVDHRTARALPALPRLQPCSCEAKCWIASENELKQTSNNNRTENYVRRSPSWRRTFG